MGHFFRRSTVHVGVIILFLIFLVLLQFLFFQGTGLVESYQGRVSILSTSHSLEDEVKDQSTFLAFQKVDHWLDVATLSSPSSLSPSFSCQRILLYASSQLDPNGIGAQLNTYWQAVLTAVATNRSLVLLHRQGQSYFGCVDNDDNNNNNDDDESRIVPGGLSRLIHTPAWLTNHCGMPCGKTTLEWLQVAHNLRHSNQERLGNNNNNNNKMASHLMTCESPHGGKETSILVLGGFSLRSYFAQRIIPALSRTDYLVKVWAARVGATTTSSLARSIQHLDDLITPPLDAVDELLYQQQEWIHQVLGQLVHMRVGSLQPWIAQGVYKQKSVWIQSEPEAAALWNGDEFYIGVHIRRGDKLLIESKSWVDQYWEQQKQQNSTKPMEQVPNYIPFSEYMKHIVEASHEHGVQRHNPINVYIATDDPLTVRQEIDAMPATEHFRFWFHPMVIGDFSSDTSIVSHIREATDCRNRYNRTLAAVMDLMLLTRSTVFVGEYNSNWGRLVRTHRTVMVDGVAHVRDVRTVWGPKETFWPR